MHEVVKVPYTPEGVLYQMHAIKSSPCIFIDLPGACCSWKPTWPLVLGICSKLEQRRPWGLSRQLPSEGVAHSPFNILTLAQIKHSIRLVQPVLGTYTLLASLTGLTANFIHLLLICQPVSQHHIG